jgi:hypothetical protein
MSSNDASGAVVDGVLMFTRQGDRMINGSLVVGSRRSGKSGALFGPWQRHVWMFGARQKFIHVICVFWT